MLRDTCHHPVITPRTTPLTIGNREKQHIQPIRRNKEGELLTKQLQIARSINCKAAMEITGRSRLASELFTVHLKVLSSEF
jgi:hypothetical protein